jgi:hypoxanthine phosphoribosyltransferase
MNKIKKLFSKKDINNRVKELSKELYDAYGHDKVVFICTLKGAVFFACDLLKNYKGNARLEFLRVSSYKGDKSTGKVELNLSISKEVIEKENIVIIEDIVDTGNTLKFLKEYLSNMNPKSIKIITLLNKKSRREVDIEADYTGFEIDDLFVVGYGLDYNQEYRNLPYIGVIKS